MRHNEYRIGIMLFAVTVLLFFGLYFLGADIHYFERTMKINSFVMPALYALGGFYSVYTYKKVEPELGFREGFRKAFIPMFLGGLLSVVTIFSFLNFIDPAAKDLLNYQYIERQKTELNNEYTKASKILANKADRDELDKKYADRQKSFSPEMVKDKDMFTFSHFSAYFGAFFLFYVILSIFLGGFFRGKKAE